MPLSFVLALHKTVPCYAGRRLCGTPVRLRNTYSLTAPLPGRQLLSNRTSGDQGRLPLS